MKKILAAMTAAATLAALIAGCGNNGGAESKTGSGEKVYKIGISQFAPHVALDASYQGFVDGLKELGYEDGKNIKLDFNNALGEIPDCSTIANKLVNNKVDLIYAIATPAAVAVAQKTKNIPIVVSAVTSPKNAEMVKSDEKPGTNVTGVSDLAPVKQQIALIPRLFPNAKTVGFIYTSSETNSKYIVDLAIAEAEKIGLKTTYKTISSKNEIKQVGQSLLPLCDVIYVPNDNAFAEAMDALNSVTEPANKPVIPAEKGMMEKGGVATYDTDYYALGKKAAKMAVDILANGKNPADMPIQYQEEFKLVLNKPLAEKIGVTFPQDVLDEAGTASK